MGIATQVATRATCNRKHVGAVLVSPDRQMLSTGYNGSIRGMPHCDDIGHLMEDGHCVRTVHAEVNAIVQAAKKGVAVEGATIYITCNPCWNCFKSITNAGISQIVYGEFYRDEHVLQREIEVIKQLQGRIGRLNEEGKVEWDYIHGLQKDPHY